MQTAINDVLLFRFTISLEMNNLNAFLTTKSNFSLLYNFQIEKKVVYLHPFEYSGSVKKKGNEMKNDFVEKTINESLM